MWIIHLIEVTFCKLLFMVTTGTVDYTCTHWLKEGKDTMKE